MLISRNQEPVSTKLARKHRWLTRTQVCTSKGPPFFFFKKKDNDSNIIFLIHSLAYGCFCKEWVYFDTQCERFYRGTERVHLIIDIHGISTTCI